MTFAKVACAVVIASLVASACVAHAAPPVKTAAFVHVVGAGNGCSGGGGTIINHPLANGNPNAVIVVTYNATAPSVFLNAGPLAVYYDATGGCGVSGRWIIYGIDNGSTPFVDGQLINVFVGAP